jgi:signal transduction histidine kinase/CheY-like chemotaxis protein
MSGGLWDAGAAISVGGKHLANWLIGQVRDATQTEETIRVYARKIEADEEEAVKAFREVPEMSQERFQKVARMLFTLANQLSTTAYQNVQQARFISERKRAEKEKEYIDAQYRQAQKAEAVGRLAGGIAHDLNNLLSPIIGYGELLLDDFGPYDERRESIHQIVKAGFGARDLVRQLLAFSRKQTLEYKLLNLNDIVMEFEKLLRRTIREDIDLNIVTISDIPTIKADIGQIEQVIMNLCVNAQDAMPQGGKLTLETALVELDANYTAHHPDTEPGQYAMLKVSDTGFGMDTETREHIFEPFYSTKGEGGTGLGLATVYGIVKQHGGSIRVESESGRGTAFNVYLPVSGVPIAEQENVQDNYSELIGSGTILLVEDNPQVRNLAGTILRRQGYELLAAESGDHAMKILAAHDGPVDLLLTDVVMPDMNGKDLYWRISEKHPDIKVLYMSGYSGNVIAQRGVLEEGVQFIQKPFTIRGLATRVKDALHS